jgi:hypothetical protein
MNLQKPYMMPKKHKITKSCPIHSGKVLDETSISLLAMEEASVSGNAPYVP